MNRGESVEQKKRRERILCEQREKREQREIEIKEQWVPAVLARAAESVATTLSALRAAEVTLDIQTARENACARRLGDACRAESDAKIRDLDEKIAARKDAQADLLREANKTAAAQSDVVSAREAHQAARDHFAWLEGGAALDVATADYEKDRERKNFELLRAAGLARQSEATRDYRKYVKLDPRLGESVSPADTWDPNWGKPNALVAPRVVSRASDNIELTKVAARRTR